MDPMAGWPESWQIEERDLVVGRELVAVLRPFVDGLRAAGLAERTVRRHLGNLWLLGGELIRGIHVYPQDRRRGARGLLAMAVDQEGGPFSKDVETEGERKSFDATCRKLHAFLEGRGQT